jgi:hypothetical protein
MPVYIPTDEKLPSSKWNLELDFAAEVLSSGEGVSGSPTVIALDTFDDSVVTSTVVQTGSVSESAGIVTLPVQAGTDGRDYAISCKITTDSSPAQVHTAYVLMPVRA